MIIRPAENKDKPQLIQFLNDFVEYHEKHHVISPELAPFEEYIDKDSYFQQVADWYLNPDKSFTYVAEVERKVIGYISGFIEKRDSRKMDTKGVIEDWFVYDEYRSQGLGQKLLEKLTETFKKQGCTHLSVNAFIDNKETIKKYRHMGFIDSDITLLKKI